MLDPQLKEYCNYKTAIKALVFRYIFGSIRKTLEKVFPVFATYAFSLISTDI
jgi:hypothetical protein